MPYLGQRPMMEGLYGSFGNPTTDDRQRLYDQQASQLGRRIDASDAAARRSALGAATSLSAGGNPFAAGRVGAQAAAQASQRVQSQAVQARGDLAAQQQAQEIAARQRQGQWAQQALGGLLGAAGQVAGMAVPALGAIGGSARALGAAPQQGGLLGGVLGGGAAPVQGGTLLGPQGMGIPQQQAPQGTPPPGMRWDPMTNQWVPV